MTGITLHCSRGTVEAHVGDRFGWWDGTSWEIVSFAEDRIYSPSGFGGTPIVKVKLIGGDPGPHMRTYMDADDCTEWCGDSVGAGLMAHKL